MKRLNRFLISILLASTTFAGIDADSPSTFENVDPDTPMWSREDPFAFTVASNAATKAELSTCKDSLQVQIFGATNAEDLVIKDYLTTEIVKATNGVLKSESDPVALPAISAETDARAAAIIAATNELVENLNKETDRAKGAEESEFVSRTNDTISAARFSPSDGLIYGVQYEGWVLSTGGVIVAVTDGVGKNVTTGYCHFAFIGINDTNKWSFTIDEYPFAEGLAVRCFIGRNWHYYDYLQLSAFGQTEFIKDGYDVEEWSVKWKTICLTNYAKYATGKDISSLESRIGASIKTKADTPTGFDSSAVVRYGVNAQDIKLAENAELAASTNGWPEGQCVFARVTAAGDYSVDPAIILGGYSAWPTNCVFHAVFYRVSTNVYANLIRKEI